MPPKAEDWMTKNLSEPVSQSDKSVNRMEYFIVSPDVKNAVELQPTVVAT